MTLPMPLRSTSRPGVDDPVRRGRAARAGPSGRKCSRSTPHGTTWTLERSAPSRISSKTSSVQVATMRSARATMSRSSSTRSRRAGVGVALVAALDDAERVEGVHDRDLELGARRRARRARTSRSGCGRRRAGPRASSARARARTRPCAAAGRPSASDRGRPGVDVVDGRRRGTARTRRGQRRGRRGGCGRRPRARGGRARARARRRGRSGRRRRRRRGRRAG